jgi:Ca-activated chloride channel homolog
MKKRRNLTMNKLGFFFCFFLMTQLVFGQSRKEIKEGIKLYHNNKFEEASIKFEKASTNPELRKISSYNLGNSLYKSGKFPEASAAYLSGTEAAQLKDPEAFHNIGNSLLQQKKYKESIEAYKNALKLNPNKDDSRYNLGYALAKLKEEEKKNQQNKDKNKDQNKDQNKDKKDQNKGDNKDKDQEKDNPKDQNKPKEQNKNSGPKPSKLSKEEAERMLEALNNQEKNLHKKKEKKDVSKYNIEKDW